MPNLGLLDQAARAATALLVHRGYHSRQVGLAIHFAVPALGGASTVSRWTRYARACGSSKASNRRWVNYSSALKALAKRIASEAEAVI